MSQEKGWNDREKNLIYLYGACRICGGPRRNVIDKKWDGSVRMYLVCENGCDEDDG